MALTQTEAFTAVQGAVVGALGVDEDEATADATLMDELGAESIDLLDILFRIERLTGTRVQAGDLANYIQGGMTDEEFGTENDMVSAVGLAHLKTVMPQLDIDALVDSLPAEEVISHLTVANLATIVTRYAAVPAG